MGVGFDVGHGGSDTNIFVDSNYNTGFNLFLGLASAVGMLIAIVFGFGWVGNRRRWYRKKVSNEAEEDAEGSELSWAAALIQIASLLLLGGGVMLVVWGSFVRADSIQNDDAARAYIALACIISGAFATLVTFTVFVRGHRHELRVNLFMAFTYFLVLPGWIIVAISFRQLSVSSGFDLLEMNVTSIRAHSDSAIECGRNGPSCIGYRGQIEVAWDVAGHTCAAWIEDTSCDAYTFDGKSDVLDDESARESTIGCLKDKVNVFDFAYEEEMGADRVDDQVLMPSNITTIDAYGSGTCDAVLSTSEHLVVIMKPVGIGMSIVGICLILFVGLQFHGQRRKVSSGKGTGSEIVDTSSSSSSTGGTTMPAEILIQESGEPSPHTQTQDEEEGTWMGDETAFSEYTGHDLVEDVEADLRWVSNYLADGIAAVLAGPPSPTQTQPPRPPPPADPAPSIQSKASF